jgi:hypothetical protein
MYSADQSTGEGQINEINAWMRSQSWYIDWFRMRGLNPNQVRLTDQQRHELASLAQQHGVQLGDRMKIDEAGNVNQMGGFAGMPTWGKALIAAAPIAATAGFGAAGMGPMAGIFGGGGGVGAGGTGAGMSAASNFAAQGASPLLGGGSLAAGGAGMAAGGALAGGGAAAAAAGGGGSLASRIPWGDIARTAIPIGGAIAANQMSQPDNNAQNGSMNLPPELQELLGLQLNRIRQAQPNYELMLNMARGMTPQWARDTVSSGGGENSAQMSELMQRLAVPR